MVRCGKLDTRSKPIGSCGLEYYSVAYGQRVQKEPSKPTFRDAFIASVEVTRLVVPNAFLMLPHTTPRAT